VQREREERTRAEAERAARDRPPPPDKRAAERRGRGVRVVWAEVGGGAGGAAASAGGRRAPGQQGRELAAIVVPTGADASPAEIAAAARSGSSGGRVLSPASSVSSGGRAGTPTPAATPPHTGQPPPPPPPPPHPHPHAALASPLAAGDAGALPLPLLYQQLPFHHTQLPPPPPPALGGPGLLFDGGAAGAATALLPLGPSPRLQPLGPGGLGPFGSPHHHLAGPLPLGPPPPPPPPHHRRTSSLEILGDVDGRLGRDVLEMLDLGELEEPRPCSAGGAAGGAGAGNGADERPATPGVGRAVDAGEPPRTPTPSAGPAGSLDGAWPPGAGAISPQLAGAPRFGVFDFGGASWGAAAPPPLPPPAAVARRTSEGAALLPPGGTGGVARPGAQLRTSLGSSDALWQGHSSRGGLARTSLPADGTARDGGGAFGFPSALERAASDRPGYPPADAGLALLGWAAADGGGAGLGEQGYAAGAADPGLPPCRYFQIGCCREGAGCRFPHVPPPHAALGGMFGAPSPPPRPAALLPDDLSVSP
jgi:hypothetical protein